MMDTTNCSKVEECHPYIESVSLTPCILNDQGDIFHCGKCEENFNTLIDFLSHKREHTLPVPENVLPSELSCRKGDSNVTKLLSVPQPSNQVWIWNSDDLVTESNNPNNSNNEINRDISSVSDDSVRYSTEQTIISEQVCIETTETTTFSHANQEVSLLLNNLTCTVCQKTFKKQFDLFLHTRSHTGEKPFQCMICGRTFSRKSNLKKHIFSHKVWPEGLAKTLPNQSSLSESESSFRYSCPYCQKLCNTYLKLKNHLKEHGHQKLFKCVQDKCSDMFVDLDSLISHINTNHEFTQYSCHICQIKLPSLREMSDHQQTHSSKESKLKDARMHTCIYCLAKFKKQENLSHHLATTDHINVCSHCNKSFTKENSLRRHLAIHDESRRFRCGICGSNFKTKNYLRAHMFTHNKEKDFECSVCSLKFSRKDILMRHIKIHQPNKKKPCPFRAHLGCMMEFTRKDKLNNHLKSHTEKVKLKRRTKKLFEPTEEPKHSTIEIIIVPLTDSVPCINITNE